MIKIANKNKKSAPVSFLALFLAVIFFSGSASAQTVSESARQINISAYIINQSNQEMVNGDYSVRFAIYSKDRTIADPYPSNSDAKIWEETQTVKLRNGMLDAFVGAANPIPATLNFTTGNYYLGIRINTDSEMVPRKRIGALPLAINSFQLQGSEIGTKEGDIPLLGPKGLLDIKMIPQVDELGTVSSGTWEGDPIADDFIDNALTGKTYNGLTLASETDGFSIAGGTTSRKLSVTGGDVILNAPGPAGSVAYSNGTGYVFSGAGTSGQLLISGGSGAPMWSTFDGEMVSPDSLDFTELADTMTLDNDLTIDTGGNDFLVNGTIQADSLIISGEATIGTLGLNLYTNTSFIPSTTGLNLGSASNHWSNLYADNLAVGALEVESTNVSGTSGEYFTINTDSVDDENMGLRFYRSALNGYSALIWDAGDSQFNLFRRENTSEFGDLNLGNLNLFGSLNLNGNTMYGNDVAGGDLVLMSTSHVSKGKIIFGNSAYDEINNRLGIGTDSPNNLLQVSGLINFDDALFSTSLGYQAGNVNAGNNNNFIGYQAGYSNTTGDKNTFTGYQAGYSNTTGRFNLFSGAYSGQNNTTGDRNIFLGAYAGENNKTGDFNSYLGYSAGNANFYGVNNVSLGYESGVSNVGSNNAFIGYRSGRASLGNNLTFMGFQSGLANVYGQGDTGIGYQSLFSLAPDSSGTGAITSFADSIVEPGVKTKVSSDAHDLGNDQEIVITDTTNYNGVWTISNVDTDADPDTFDIAAPYVADDATGNWYILTPTNNTALGYQAGYSNVSGANNFFGGYQAGYSNDTGGNNFFGGYQAGYSNTTGISNLFNGYQSGYSNTTGEHNTSLGDSSLFSNVDGSSNVSLGSGSLYAFTTGNQNVALGRDAGGGLVSGDGNVFLGYASGYSASGSNNVFLGYNAGFDETGSDKLYIENSASASPLIYGDFTDGSELVRINGNTEINSLFASTTFSIIGDAADTNIANPYVSILQRGLAQAYTGDAIRVLLDEDASFASTGKFFAGYNSDNNNPKLTLNADGGAYFGGNVGIGTADPGAYKLYVEGGQIYGSSHINAAGSFMSSSGGSVSVPTFNNNDDNGMYFPAANSLGLVTNGAEALRINSSGNVGIGTTDPTKKLTVDGSQLINLVDDPVIIGSLSSPDLLGSFDAFLYGDYLYVASTDNNRLAIVDVSDPSSMHLESYTESGLVSPQSIFVSGDYAYVIDANGLFVFDISDPKSIVLTSQQSIGISTLYVSGRYAYATGNDGVVVLDISDPSNIVVKGSTTALGSQGNGIFVNGNYAYVTSLFRLSIFDISDPDNIVAKDSTTTNINLPQRDGSLAVAGNYAYVINPGNNTLAIFDISDPDAIGAKDTIAISGGTPACIAVAGDYAYVSVDLALSSEGIVSTFDVSDPDNIALIGESVSTGANYSNRIFVRGGKIYVNHDDIDSNITVFEVNNLDTPNLVADSANIFSLSVRDDASFDKNVSIRSGLAIGAGLGVAQDLSVGGEAFFSGNVGIGTADPNNKLEVYSSTGTVASRIHSGDGVILDLMALGNGYGWIGTSSWNSMRFGANGGSQLVLHRSGGISMGDYYETDPGAGDMIISSNVGIGTTDPLALLSVGSASSFQVTSTGLIGLGGATPLFSLGVDSTDSNKFKIYSGTSIAGTSEFTIDSDGLVSIPNLEMGAQAFADDSGAISWIDMGVTGSVADNTVESYTAQLDGNNILTIYGLADGSGGMDNLGVGIGTIAPSNLLDLEIAGSAKGSTDFLEITNSGNAADMDATLSSILFHQWYYDASTPAVADAGRITFGTETDWTGTASTQDSFLAFQTALDGTVAEKMRITSGGNVGIGITAPTALLHLDGVAGKVSFEINSDETTAGNNVLALRSDVAGANDLIFRVQADGAVYADGAYTGTGADYAEYFETTDTDLESGEAVCIDPLKENAVKRCVRSADNNVMGIISSNPSIVGNSADGREKDPKYKIVAMLGQIQGKVSNENGTIQIGDSLTPASVPGYLRKADPEESTVGVALQNFSQEKGDIQILISRRNKSLTVEKVEEAVSQRIAEMNVEDQVNALITKARAELDQASESRFAGIDSQILAQQNLIALLQAQMAELQTRLNAETNLAQIDLNTQDTTFIKLLLGVDRVTDAEDVDILGRLSAKTLATGGIEIVIADPETKTIGEGTIAPDKNVELVKTKAATKDSKIYITPVGSTGNQVIYVGAVNEAEGFEVMVDRSDAVLLPKEIRFNWWIVETKD